MPNGPLSGIRVFDLTIAMVGPWCAMQLGGMGADVVHVEAREAVRAGVPPSINGTSIGYITWNMNKRGIQFDLKAQEDRADAYELLKTCDVFLMNMRPDVAARLGVDYESVSRVNPGIVYVAVTGWGQTGPMRDLPGADGQIQHYTGFGSANGEEGADEGEIYRHFTQIDATTGNYACQAILMGLLARKKTGKGQRIDVSMLRAATAMQTGRVTEYLASKQNPKPLGSKSQAVAPSQAFLCHDQRYLSVEATSEAEWRALCAAIRHPALADDARFATNSDRVAHRDELSALLESVFASMPLDYWVIELGKVDVPHGRPMRWDEIRNHQQVLQNDYLVEIETKSWGTVWTGGPPWHFAQTPARWFRTPELGEHGEEIMRDVREGRPVVAPAPASTPARNQ